MTARLDEPRRRTKASIEAAESRERAGNLPPAAKALVAVCADALDGVVPVSMREWTDEQWRAHDASAAAANAARLAIEYPDERPTAHPLELLGWPRRAVREAMGADVTHPAVAQLLRVMNERDAIAIVSGSHGCGKTVGAARWAMTHSPMARFVRAATFAKSSRYDAHTQELVRSSALVVDDLGAEYLDEKGSFLVDLDELIDTFYGDCRPLVITTNCNVKTFQERYGARIYDRLRECGRWISIASPSLRRKK